MFPGNTVRVRAQWKQLPGALLRRASTHLRVIFPSFSFILSFTIPTRLDYGVRVQCKVSNEHLTTCVCTHAAATQIQKPCQAQSSSPLKRCRTARRRHKSIPKTSDSNRRARTLGDSAAECFFFLSGGAFFFVVLLCVIWVIESARLPECPYYSRCTLDEPRLRMDSCTPDSLPPPLAPTPQPGKRVLKWRR